MKPLISVIIPSYNSAKTLPIAVQSILEQTYPNLEIIIVNDNSKDKTEAIAKKYAKKYPNVKYYSSPIDDSKRFNIYGININAGYMARNYGIEKSRGEWITFQDADDASFTNRIEIQYKMAKKLNSNHLCIGWIKFNKKYLGKKLNIKKFSMSRKNLIVSSKEIINLAKQNKGIAFSILNKYHKYIPLIIKRRPFLKNLFYKSWDPYPGCASAPLVHKKVFKKVKFRPLTERVWPSKKGRGADRDFNFQAAETFSNSIVIKLPLYLWQQSKENPYFKKIDKKKELS
jgi:hypothetical protein